MAVLALGAKTPSKEFFEPLLLQSSVTRNEEENVSNMPEETST